MKYKKGDTLIEVTLAIGVFSMIAIAVVSVMNTGTSGVQSALETTLAREEIDAQAEALRFIQSSYIADKDSERDDNGDKSRSFHQIWKEITGLAVNPSEAITNYSPKSCKEAYSDSALSKAFIINTKQLGNYDTITSGGYSGDSLLLTMNSSCSTASGLDGKCMKPATTYPRLIYRNTYNQPEEELIDTRSNGESYYVAPPRDKVYSAEGIYIIAVKDEEKGTTIVSDTANPDKKSAFYDFYIRTCWYSSGANTPSTISTVIRLYDPDAVAERDGVILNFNPNGGNGEMASIFVPAGKAITLPLSTFRWHDVDEDLYEVVGWSSNSLTTVEEVNAEASGTYKNGGVYKAPSSTYSRERKALYAVWDIDRFWVDVNLFLDGVRRNSGLAEFKVKSYIDGVYVDESNNGKIVDGTHVTLNDHDFYQPVYFGSKLRIELFDTEGYTLDKSEASLCQNVIGSCTVTSFDGGTAVEFTANGIPEGTVINDSNQYAINIEPHWTTNPPEEPEEP